MVLQKGDFIELNYTGKTDDSEQLVFDTTDETVAKKEGIYDKRTNYGPAIVVLGEGHLLPGLDNDLIGKEIGKEYEIHIKDVDGFGKKSAKKLQLVPQKVFRQENIRPEVGLQINVDGTIGVVRNVNGGRIIVDFNHPLSSKDLIYTVTINRVVENKKEQVEAFFKLMGFKADAISADEEKVTITTSVELPKDLTTPLTQDIKRLTKAKEIIFQTKKNESKNTTTQKEKSE